MEHNPFLMELFRNEVSNFPHSFLFFPLNFLSATLPNAKTNCAYVMRVLFQFFLYLPPGLTLLLRAFFLSVYPPLFGNRKLPIYFFIPCPQLTKVHLVNCKIVCPPFLCILCQVFFLFPRAPFFSPHGHGTSF